MAKNVVAIIITFITFIAFWFLMSAFFQFQEEDDSIRRQIAQWFGWFIVPGIATYFVPEAVSKWFKADFKVVLFSFVTIIVVLGLFFGSVALYIGSSEIIEIIALVVQVISVLFGADAISRERYQSQL